ncbi:MAG: glycosyltransferase family 2 protein [Actinomycetia bacterium]|nr:glycosyltransferase family 2 protein [Actinomycetes bacterium]
MDHDRNPSGEGPVAARPRVSVVLPTYEEADNIGQALDEVGAALKGIPHEVIVVDDDSPDLTWKVARDHPSAGSRVLVIRRTEARGLSGAVVAGLQAARGDVLAVMDADLQHDPTILPGMVEAVSNGADVAVGSRAVDGGGYGEWSITRRLVSWVATLLARLAVGTELRDPMSGFFALSRSYYESTVAVVNPRGFKILLEFVSRGKPRVVELGYVFRERQHGATKLTSGVIVHYVLALIDLRFGRVVSTRFVKYAMVGSAGALVNLLTFLVARAVGATTTWSVILGVETSILFNYFAHNTFTFRAERHTGRHLVWGFGFFQVVSLYGLVVQLAVFRLVEGEGIFDWMGAQDLSNAAYAAVAILVATVGNYFLNVNFTWSWLGRSVR